MGYVYPMSAAEAPGTYHVQPMTGTVHRDAGCSVGTARYGTTPATLSDAELDAMVAAGRVKGCRRCYT